MSDEQIKVNIEITIPQDLFQKLLQHFRDFDIAHKNRCRFDITSTSDSMTATEVTEILGSIVPPFGYESVFDKNDA